MLSKTKMLSAMIGLALLAMPTAAFAGHHDHDHFDGPRWHHGPEHGWRGDWHDRGWHNGWDRHEDDDDNDNGWRGDQEWGNRGWNYNANNYGYVPGGYYNPNQMNSLIAQRQRAMIELQRMRARGDSRAAARMATIVQGLDGRIAGARGGYGYAAPVAPVTPYQGAYNPYGYGNYPYYGNTANAIGSLMGPLFGLR